MIVQYKGTVRRYTWYKYMAVRQQPQVNFLLLREPQVAGAPPVAMRPKTEKNNRRRRLCDEEHVWQRSIGVVIGTNISIKP